MSFRQSLAMWATLIGACWIHGNTENPGYYVLIANMYGAAGYWDKLAGVRVVMRDRGPKKPHGCTFG